MAEDRTFTQEEVNKLVGQARLEGKEIGRKEFEGWISPDKLTETTAELENKLAGLSKQIEVLTGEKTDLQTKLSEKDGLIAKYETDSVKTKIAKENGLPYEAVEFLQGDSEEAIRQSAEAMKGLIGAGSSPQPSFTPEPSDMDETVRAWKQLAKDIHE
jgi:hypothetical protein